MQEIRCQQCNKFLFKASGGTLENPVTIVVWCPRCRQHKSQGAERKITFPFKTVVRSKENAVAGSPEAR